MNVDAEAAAIVRAATKPPKTVKRERLCQYAGPFCVFCEEIPPCVRNETYQDCDMCGELDCPCMVGWTIERRAAFQKWKGRHDAANTLTVERKVRYGHRRWRKNAWRDMSKAYSQGRTCAGKDCNKRITNKNKSGLCKSCSGLKRNA